MSKPEKRKILIIPDKCSPGRFVKWTKKDDLDRLAKAHGLKSGNEIWESLGNRLIVKKRRKKENLQPGDELYIPAPRAVERRLFKEVEKYNQTQQASARYARQLEDRIAVLEEHLHELHHHVGRLTLDGLEGARSGELVDTVAAITGTVENAMRRLPMVKAPPRGVALRFEPALSIAAALKAHRRTMKGGGLDQKLLDDLKKQSIAARKEITSLRQQLDQVHRFVEETGARTITAFCKERKLMDWATEVFKASNVRMPK